MKRLRHILKALFRSKFDKRGAAIRAESRAEMKRMVAEGRAWEEMLNNVSYLGIKTDSDDPPKMIFTTREKRAVEANRNNSQPTKPTPPPK